MLNGVLALLLVICMAIGALLDTFLGGLLLFVVLFGGLLYFLGDDE